MRTLNNRLLPRLRLAGAALLASGLALVSLLAPGPAAAQAPFCQAGQSPRFVHGFLSLAEVLGDVMGSPVECEHAEASTGDAHQQTTTGLAFYRKSTNTPTFTTGFEHWALTPDGPVYWTGESIDPPGAAVAPAPEPGPAQEPITRPEPAGPPAMEIDPNTLYSATIETSLGIMKAELFAMEAPLTVNNFVALARQGYYDGVIFHRVIKGFMAQTGDPTGTGRGGPGYVFMDEPVTRRYERGTLAMANRGPNTNGSQFFIMHQDYPLPPNYTIFGNVTEGIETLDRITDVRTGPGRGGPDTPQTEITINSVTIEP
jgi:cyclophilin family peptidyl-prolyl cis-trans isomerase